MVWTFFALRRNLFGKPIPFVLRDWYPIPRQGMRITRARTVSFNGKLFRRQIEDRGWTPDVDIPFGLDPFNMDVFMDTHTGFKRFVDESNKFLKTLKYGQVLVVGSHRYLFVGMFEGNDAILHGNFIHMELVDEGLFPIPEKLREAIAKYKEKPLTWPFKFYSDDFVPGFLVTASPEAWGAKVQKRVNIKKGKRGIPGPIRTMPDDIMFQLMEGLGESDIYSRVQWKAMKPLWRIPHSLTRER